VDADNSDRSLIGFAPFYQAFISTVLVAGLRVLLDFSQVEIFQNVDWKTRVLTTGFNLLYLNLQGARRKACSPGENTAPARRTDERLLACVIRMVSRL
jgi:hypothetical protein